MTRVSTIRAQRMGALVKLGNRLVDEDGVTPENLRDSLRRHILIHYGGSVNTVALYVEEAIAKIEHARELASIRALA